MMTNHDTHYSNDYVEIKTSLECIKTKLDGMDTAIRDLHQMTSDTNEQIGKNRTEIASVKATAAIVGGLSGTLIAVFLRFFLTSLS